MFYQSRFNDFILENNICGFSEEGVILASGRLSHFYVNWKTILQSAYQTRRLISYILDFALEQGIEVDTYYGVPEGATPFGLLTQFEFSKRNSMKDHVIAMGRKEIKKDHGLKKAKNFVSCPQGETVVIEDVTTVATNLIPVLENLLEEGINVTAVISLTNRMEKRDDGLSVKEKIEQMGIPFYQMSSAPEILKAITEIQTIEKMLTKKVEKYYRRYGIKKLILT